MTGAAAYILLRFHHLSVSIAWTFHDNSNALPVTNPSVTIESSKPMVYDFATPNDRATESLQL